MARVNNDELDELILGEVKLCLQAEGKNLKARMFPWALTSHEKRVKYDPVALTARVVRQLRQSGSSSLDQVRLVETSIFMEVGVVSPILDKQENPLSSDALTQAHTLTIIIPLLSQINWSSILEELFNSSQEARSVFASTDNDKTKAYSDQLRKAFGKDTVLPRIATKALASHIKVHYISTCVIY